MKRNVRNRDLTTKCTVSANIARATEAFLANIPKLETVCLDVRRQHAVVIRYPQITTKKTKQFEILPPFRAIKTKEQFTYYDN